MCRQDKRFARGRLHPATQILREIRDIFADMGGALHDAVADPDIAEAMQATPEALLEKAKALS